MLSFSFAKLFGRAPPALIAGAVLDTPALAPDAVAPAPRKPSPPSEWPAQRLAVTDQLWGSGFITPGGELEILRLIRPLALSGASSLLLIGIGSGGPASLVVRNTGTWVTGLETDLSLIAAAQALAKRDSLGRKAVIKLWNPQKPDFVAKGHHHCLALEPLHGAPPEPILDGLEKALKPGGHLVVTELTAPAPLAVRDRTVRRWAKLENRDPEKLVPAIGVTRMLGRIGLDVRVAEDTTQRHLDHAMVGWRVLVHDLAENKPSPMTAAFMVAEAERWLLRRRLMQEGKLQMMRWHAIKRIPII